MGTTPVTVTLGYDEYQDLLASKTKREVELEQTIEKMRKWSNDEKDAHQAILLKIVNYRGIESLNSFLGSEYGIKLRKYLSGSLRTPVVTVESIR